MRKPFPRRSFRYRPEYSCLLLVTALAGSAHGQQVVPSGSAPPSQFPDFGRPTGSAFLVGTVTDREFSFAKELGYTTGGTLAFTPHLALAGEWTMEHWHGPLHTYLGLVGPRVSWPVGPAGRFVPFGAVFGGVGHAGTAGPNHLLPPNVKPSYYGFATGVELGLEVRLVGRLSWRIDAAEARINTVPVNQPATGSMGLVLRVFGPNGGGPNGGGPGGGGPDGRGPAAEKP